MPTLSNKVDVLVVGAGPAGLLAALELARAGVEVEVIDRASRPTGQNYACGLHAATVELLSSLGLGALLLEAGRRVDRVGFFEGSERRAELRLNELRSAHPYLLVLSQERLEEVLETELRRHGVRVRWSHRLDELTQDDNSVTATVEKLALTSVGYPFARSEEMVQNVIDVRAQYVLGCDGSASHVRQILGIGVDRTGPSAAYEMFEFEPESDAGGEVCVALGDQTTDAFWPEAGSMGRWCLQTKGLSSETTLDADVESASRDDPAKADDATGLTECLRARAPWFDAGVKEIESRTLVAFDPSLAQSFGHGRCWLAGDAGHQTSPVGMQSINVGLREAVDLTGRITRRLSGDLSAEALSEYGCERRTEWQDLLGAERRLRDSSKGEGWPKARRQRLLACIPASGPDLAVLAGQLGLEFV